ncbi:hypothetical protein OS493_007744 [Desmophyllum pertusum]|uniref:Ubiquitin-like domain-containing protein n=1 Tax=Desmophyllum pertusum TaxID=174260 RepID=A0A9X0CLL4_9CNID|nr:hypothetical protein OS493_007744 [Desmophyllum pertusum]
MNYLHAVTCRKTKKPCSISTGSNSCPTKNEGTLTSLGVSSGSRLELKVKILFIEVFIEVSFLDHTSPTSVRCSPQDTFQDLVKKIKIKGKKREQESVTFVMEERVFDPDQGQRSTARLRSYASLSTSDEGGQT